jgi:hypothetical protein
MTVGLLITVLLIVMPVIFVLASFFTRSPAKRIGAALVGGLIGAFVGAGLDVAGSRLGLWHYVTASPDHAPWPIYVAAGFLQGAAALIGWRIHRRFGVAGLLLWIGAVAAGATVQDYVAAALGPKVQVIAPGFEPAIGDFIVWTIVTSVTVILMCAFAGAPSRDATERFA